MKRKSAFFTLVLFGISLHGDWHSFRGPNGNGSTDYEIPQKPKLIGSESWSVDLPGRGLSSPISVNDAIFLTASSGANEETLHILAFHADSGEALWESKFKATGRTICHKKTSVAASTLSSDGKCLIAQFSSNDIFCLDFKGNLRWFRGLGFDNPNIANGLGMSSSPLIVDGIAVVQVENDAESFSYGLDIMTGETRWEKKRPKAANWTSPILMQNGKKVIIGLQSKEGLAAVEPKTGKLLWAYEDGASTIPSSSWTRQNIALVPSNGITALKVDEDLTSFRQIWRENKLNPGTGSPSSMDGKLYVINNANVLTCASVETGEIEWRLRLKGPISSSPIIGKNHLIVFSETGLGQMVDLRKKEPKAIQVIDLEDTILCTPALSTNAIIVRSDSKLWKLSD